MAKRPYLREWRESKGYTLAYVAGALDYMDDPKLPTTAASISRIEAGKQPYSEPVLNALAEVYQTEVDQLFVRNPLKAGQVIHLDDYTDAEVTEAVAVFEAIRNSRRSS